MPTSGETGSSSFTVALPSPTSDQCTITFYTRVTDEGLLDQGQSSKTYTNQAELDSDEVVNLTTSANISVGNPVIVKDYVHEDGTDIIDWSVAINAGQVALYNAVVMDDLNDDLELIPSSLKLYAVGVASNGTVNAASTGVLIDGAAYTVILPTTSNGNTLEVQLPDGAQAYRLEFSTYVLADNLNVVNEVDLTGQTGSPTGTTTSGLVTISELWSSGGSGSGSLTVYKSDGAGNPVEGATYRLLSVNQTPILRNGNFVEAITDADGNAQFINLPAWIFYMVEVEPPAGFLLNPTFIGGERLNSDLLFETSNALAIGDLSFAKEDANGSPLSGGTFTLTGTDFNSDPVQRTASSINGIVTFSDLPLGSYTVTETIAPDGYAISDDQISATIDYNADMTDVVVSITSPIDTIVNAPMPYGSIELLKTDGVAPLAGATFVLYDADGDSIGTSISDSEGLVRFTEVPLGSYTIRETATPFGHTISSEIASASITVDAYATIVNADPYTIVNERIGATVRIIKVDGATNRRLTGAVFALSNADKSVSLSAETDSSGVATFYNIMPDTYSVIETTAPNGYLRSDTTLVLRTQLANTVSYYFQNTAIGSLPQSGYFFDGVTLLLLGGLLTTIGTIFFVIRKRQTKHRKK